MPWYASSCSPSIRRLHPILGVVALAFAMMPVASHALLLEAGSAGLGSLGDPNDPNSSDVCYEITTTETSIECSSGPTTVRTASGSAAASVDSVTGELRARAAQSVTNSAEDGVLLGGTAFSQLREEFSVQGTGFITAYLDIKGSWDLTPFYDYPSDTLHYNQAGLLWRSPGNPGSVIAHETLFLEPTLAVTVANVLIQLTTYVYDGTQISLQAYLLAQFSPGGQGAIDFYDTARLFVQASPGVVLTPSSSTFLSNPAFRFPTTVPEPVGIGMLLIGLAAIGWLVAARRRSPIVALVWSGSKP